MPWCLCMIALAHTCMQRTLNMYGRCHATSSRKHSTHEPPPVAAAVHFLDRPRQCRWYHNAE